MGLRSATVDGTWKVWEAGGAGWFLVVGLRMVAAFGGTLVDVFSIIVWTSRAADRGESLGDCEVVGEIEPGVPVVSARRSIECSVYGATKVERLIG